MSVKIRLQRHGKKGKPFYHVVAADARAKRDGRFIEKVGTYNPNTNPATIDIKFDRALHWVKVGAQPTDTVRALLSYTGVLMKDHLDRGVAKGAHTQEEADAKFAKWQEGKQKEITAKVDGLAKAQSDDKAARLKAETEVKEKRAAELAAKAKEAEEAAAAAAAEAAGTEEEAAEENSSEEAAE